ncbi:MAG: relaxase/mobilization nuclease domain-containing protein [Robiginitomaculum sp.]|nr:relaxase/mobilization nuclease domain-containing protein [Robiginitomaculum sp.]
MAKGTKCQQYMFSLSLNPPQNAEVSEADLIKAADQAEERLGLKNQPRAIVFHEKEGRRHAHVVWSRIDASKMRAINLPHFKQKLTDLSRELYLDHGWKLPNGLRRDGVKSPLNFTLAEWQQAKRLKLDPREIKQVFQEAWSQADNGKAFKNALEERGYYLPRGDRRGFVALNIEGEVFSIPKWVGVKTKEVRARLGKENDLPPLDQARADLASKLTDKVKTLMRDVKARHDEELRPLFKDRQAMAEAHRMERKQLALKQETRWKKENAVRLAKLNKGLRGLWQKISGKSRRIQKDNEAGGRLSGLYA